jgi:hypothetical protein
MPIVKLREEQTETPTQVKEAKEKPFMRRCRTKLKNLPGIGFNLFSCLLSGIKQKQNAQMLSTKFTDDL